MVISVAQESPSLVEIIDWWIITLEGTEKGLNEGLISVSLGVK